MEKKKLKSLKLNKEEIVNLNEYEMNDIQGGAITLTSSMPCVNSIIQSISLIAGTIGAYSVGKQEGWWTQANEGDPKTFDPMSTNDIWIDGVAHCAWVDGSTEPYAQVYP